MTVLQAVKKLLEMPIDAEVYVGLHWRPVGPGEPINLAEPPQLVPLRITRMRAEVGLPDDKGGSAVVLFG